ncbi:MAG: hypothetical protein Q7T44_10555 [Parvibaculum sp.]|nr:hypothetical protein [Parvibaculum sp.]
MFTKLIGLAFAASLLAGCAIGNKIDYRGQMPAMAPITQGKTVSLGVQDARPYVLSGDKAPSFVGLQRGGYGNPFDVTTTSGQPLADDLLQTFSTMLKRGGANVTSAMVPGTRSTAQAIEQLSKNGSDRVMLISFREWKSDSFMNAWVMYDITAKVFDKSGKLLGEKSLQGKDAVTAGAAYAGSESNNSITDASTNTMRDLMNAPQIVAALQ